MSKLSCPAFSPLFWSLSLAPFRKLVLELEMKLPLSLGSDLAVPPSGYATCLLMSAHSNAEPPEQRGGRWTRRGREGADRR